MITNDKNNVQKQPKARLVTRLDDKLPEEVAIKELSELVEIYAYTVIDHKKAKKDYPQALMAMRKGLLVIKDDIPVYRLFKPITGKDEITFKTRIKPIEMSNVTKGVNVQEEQMSLALVYYAELSGLTRGELNALDKFDYKVIEQVASIFF